MLGVCKSPTSQDVTSGIVAAVQSALAAAGVVPERSHAMMIGTTNFTNALLSVPFILNSRANNRPQLVRRHTSSV